MRRDDHRIFDVPFRYPPYTTFGLKVFRAAVVNGKQYVYIYVYMYMQYIIYFIFGFPLDVGPSFTSITFGQFLSRIFVGSAVVAGVAAGVYYGVK